ncbi:MAG: hypothetical protein JO041_07060 [Acidobacteria bacterium]|nr:hypothetical protein [Acidobacteriota bacterium]
MVKIMRLVLLASGLSLWASPLWAGDCSGPDDCGAVPDNFSKSMVVVSIFAGAGLAFRSANGSDTPTTVEKSGNGDSGSGDWWAELEAPGASPAPAGTQPPDPGAFGDPGDLPDEPFDPGPLPPPVPGGGVRVADPEPIPMDQGEPDPLADDTAKGGNPNLGKLGDDN